MYETILRNGQIIDGTGSSVFTGDVALENGIIKEIKHTIGDKAEKEIDVEEAVIAPGFIDVSNHSDTHLTLFTQPSLTSLVRQGITTIIGGNCGTSLAPFIGGKAIESVRRWVPMNRINVNWLTTYEYYQELERRKMRLNYGTLVGYLTVRRGLLKDEFRPVTDEELDALLKMIEEAFQEGALGVSFGLAYSHMYMADKRELEAVARLVADYDRILTVHMRDEGSGVLDSVREVIDITRNTGVHTEISHLKILGEKNWDFFQQVQEELRAAIEEEELPLEYDIFPYQANNGVLYLQLPYWVTKGGKKDMMERLQDVQTKNKVISEMKRNSNDFSKMVISSAPHAERLIGKTVQEVAENQGVGLEEAIINLIIATNSQIRTLNYGIKSDHMESFAEQNYSTIGSDGVGFDNSVFEGHTYVHPRSFGAFPRFWSDQNIDLSAEERIHKMTGKPALHYGLSERGFIKKGYSADIIVFDPEKFTSRATLKDPFHYGKGIRHLFINGNEVVKEDEVYDVYAGDLLKR